MVFTSCHGVYLRPFLQHPGGNKLSKKETFFPMPEGRVRNHPVRTPTPTSLNSSASSQHPSLSPSSTFSFKSSSDPRPVSKLGGDLQPGGALAKILSKSDLKLENWRMGNKHPPLTSPQNSFKPPGFGRSSSDDPELPSFLKKYPGVSRDLSRSPRLLGPRGRDSPMQHAPGQRNFGWEGRQTGERGRRRYTDPIGQHQWKVSPSPFNRVSSLGLGPKGG